MHYKTFPALTGTPSALKEQMRRDNCKMKELVPGEVLLL